MLDIQSSAVESVGGALVGLIVEVNSISLIDAGLLNFQTRVVYQVLNIVAIFIFVHTTRNWGISYFFGWGAGLFFLQLGGTGHGFGLTEFLIYLVALIFILITKALAAGAFVNGEGGS